MDDWGIDAAMTWYSRHVVCRSELSACALFGSFLTSSSCACACSSQKALGVPPGLCIIAFSQRALVRSHSCSCSACMLRHW